MPKSLADLKGRWLSVEGRSGVGVSFECPCGCPVRIAVGFHNPIDGGAKEVVGFDREDKPIWWQRSGETLERLTLSPSIVVFDVKDKQKEHWHGHIRAGQVTS